jgi:ABC-type amino acid transport substrate-binding protein
MQKLLTYLVLMLGITFTAHAQGLPPLVLGTSADYAPFEFVKDGQVVGFDIDVAKAVAEKMGRTLEIKEMDFAALIPALQAGRVDMVMAGLNPTAERARAVDFSIPYYRATFAVISPKAAPIKAPGEFVEKNIGVQLSSTMESYVRQEALRTGNVEITPVASAINLVQELKVGRVDAIVVDAGVAHQAVTSLGKEYWVYTTLYVGDLGKNVIALQKGSALREKIDTALRTLDTSGWLDTTASRWNMQ